jgi:hypothetical protein
MAFKSLSKKSNGPHPKGEQLIIYDKLNTFFKTEFIKLISNDTNIIDINEYKFDSTNLSYIFNLFAKEMEISYKNNIILNFFKRVNQYVNQIFIEKNVTRLTKNNYQLLTKNEKSEYSCKIIDENERIKAVKKEINLVKNDLFDDTLLSDKKYHKWIKENKNIIFPVLETGKLDYESDIKINHHKYLIQMLKMNSILEQNNKKLLSPISLRSEVTDKYVHIDTSVLKDIFNEVTTKKSNKEIWDKYFNIDGHKFKLKNYSFNNQISTDGYSVSINFIKNTKIDKKNQKIKAWSDASKKTRKLRQNKNADEVKQIIVALKQKNLDDSIKKQLDMNEKKKQNQKKFKKLPKEEQEKIKLEIKLKKNKFEYIEDAIDDKTLSKNLSEKWKNGYIKVCDPGKFAPLTIYGEKTIDKKMLDKLKKEVLNNKPQLGKSRKGKILFNYTLKRRLQMMKRIKYMKLILNKRKKTILNGESIEHLEQKLNGYNSKTVNYDKFNEYSKIKMNIRNKVSENKYDIQKQKMNEININDAINIKNINDYVNEGKIFIEKYKIENLEKGVKYNRYIRKLKWFAYINKRRHEDELLNELEKIYGKEAVFIIGDWSNKGKIRKISTPNIGMKKLLSKRFEVYLIDEFNTSKLHYKTEEETENMKIEKEYEKDGKIFKYTKKIHSILTFKMGKIGSGCINRDYNACLNMEKIVNSYFQTKTRPLKYRRSEKKLIAPKGDLD